MTQQTLNPFRFQTYESVYGARPRRRRSRLAAQTIAVLLAISIPVLPVSPAFSQVLEVPQVISAPASPPSSSRNGSASGLYGSAPGSYGSAPEGSAGDRDAYGSPNDPDSNGSAPAGYAADPNAYNGSATPSSPDANGDPNAPADPANAQPTVASNSGYAPDPNLGSIDDYQNQQGGNAQSAPGVTFGGGAQPNEPPQSMTTKLIVGGLIVGLVALGTATSHHHR
jgi:hypothetical protein